ncbi:MAG: chorismate synthase [Bacteroidales bacterium]|nr:chorismate synthase [Bacteroidales bacterium]
MNAFGNIFQIHLSGTSHSKYIEIEITGCPSGIFIDPEQWETDLNRRKPLALGTTTRHESDIPEILQGINHNITNGDSIKIRFKNEDCDSNAYSIFQDIPRPSHADFVAQKKYGTTMNLSGGGFFSGRMTVALVAAGVIARQIIQPTTISAVLTEAGGSADILSNVAQAVSKHDSIGGIIRCSVQHLPIGWGEPFFDGLESTISHIVFSIPGIKAIEFGSGFESAQMFGSNHNDCFIDENGTTKTNHAGGINGGISNGNELYFKVAVKPTASIELPQQTFNFKTKKMDILSVKGRHDACFALRVPVVIESVTAIALADAYLCHQKK